MEATRNPRSSLHRKRRERHEVDAGAGMANWHYAVAATDWESVGGAWTPGSEESPADCSSKTAGNNKKRGIKFQRHAEEQ